MYPSLTFVGLEFFSEVISRQHTPFLRLLNVDACRSDTGPAVPIRLSTSANASITLHSDGNSEMVGDISVWPLPCADSHTQVYGVSVTSADDYTLCGEIINSLLPIACVLVPASGEPCISTHSFIYVVILLWFGLVIVCLLIIITICIKRFHSLVHAAWVPYQCPKETAHKCCITAIIVQLMHRNTVSTLKFVILIFVRD